MYFENENQKNELFTGRLPKYNEVNIILNMIEKVSDVNFEIEGKKIIIR